MKVLFVLSCFVAVSLCGVIHHEDEHGHKATSYQNVHIEHFHAVPTYVKKEDSHLLHHPVSVGNTHANVEVQHGDKHDHGYAVASFHSEFEGKHHGADELSAGHEFEAGGGEGAEEYQSHGHEGLVQAYEGGEAGGHGFEDQGHYQGGEEAQTYDGHQEEAAEGHY